MEADPEVPMWMLLLLALFQTAHADDALRDQPLVLAPRQRVVVALSTAGGAAVGAFGVGAAGAGIGYAIPERCFLICAGPIVGGGLGGLLGGVGGGVAGNLISKGVYRRRNDLTVVPVVRGDRVGMVGAVTF